MTVRVRDRSRGFDPAASTTGFGLLGMRERVEELGGRLILESAPGKGVAVTAALPASPRVSGLRRSG
jgi:signal transduction histidine kinase